MRTYTKANEIANDYIKYHLWDEMEYEISDDENGVYYSIKLRQSFDIIGGILVELYEHGGNGLIEVLTETKETLVSGITYMFDMMDNTENEEIVTEYTLDVTFSVVKGKTNITVKDVESGIYKTWSDVDVDPENLSRICGHVGDDIMSWIELRAEAEEE